MEKREFYRSKGKLFLSVVVPILFISVGVLGIYMAYVEETILIMMLSLFIIILFSFFAIANLLKFIRGYPYITITDEYIQLDAGTKSEATIYFSDIQTIKVTKIARKHTYELILYDEDAYFSRLSFHNKVRLCMNPLTGYAIFTFSPEAVDKNERSTLLLSLSEQMKRKDVG